jgi:IclR family transcriptional regulator, acetate operon repressor
VTTSKRNLTSKSLRALSWLAESETTEVGVRQLAAAMKIAPSSAHRVLLALSDAGFVTRHCDTQRYALSPEFLRLAHCATARMPRHHLGATAMQRLVERCGESALLVRYDNARQEMIFDAAVDAEGSAPSTILLNTWMPVRTGASGMAILAFLDDGEIQSIICRAKDSPSRGRAYAEPDRLAADLNAVRRQGFAYTRCQWVAGAIGIAAPIFNRTGKVTGDICVTIPQQRAGEASREGLIDALRACASNVTRELRN